MVISWGGENLVNVSEEGDALRVWWKNVKENDNLKDSDIDDTQ